MKRLVLTLGAFGAFGVAWFGASAGGQVEAYQPAAEEDIYATPATGLPGYEFDAVVIECYPGEPVVFSMYPDGGGNDPVGPPLVAQTAVCDPVTLDAISTFEAPAENGMYEIHARLDPYVTPNPDIPDRIGTLDLTTFVTVDENFIPIQPAVQGPSVSEVSTTGDSWKDFAFSTGVYRVFFGLLALLIALLLVVLWRRRNHPGSIYRPAPAEA